MATHYSPKIVTDDLVFYYDKANTKKSWIGKPTTNLQPDLSLSFFQGITGVYLGVEDGWKKYSLAGTWASGTYPYCMIVTSTSFTGGSPYSTGVYIKSNVMGKFASKFTGINYVNQPQDLAGTSFSVAQPDGSLFVGRKGFQYTSTTTQGGYLVARPLADGTTFVAATDFVWIKEGQIEAGLINTPYVNGTRSNTEAIEDMIGENTITANSLTYTQDDFEFDGISDYLSSAYAGSATNQSFQCWVNISSTNLAGTFLKIGGGATGFSLGVGSGTTIIAGNDIIGLFPAIRWLDTATALGTGWKLVTMVMDGSSVPSIYLNDTLVGAYPGTAPVTPQANIYVGANIGDGTRHFAGDISQALIYNKALTSIEIKQNFEATRGRFGI